MKNKKKRVLTNEELELMKELYPEHSTEEVARIMGLSVWTVKSRARKHGWHKANEYKISLYREIARRTNAALRINTPEAYSKRLESMLKLHRVEKCRIRFGLEQKTKRHYRVEPIAKQYQRNYLRSLGYIIDEANLVAYYTPGTHRATRIEAIPRGTTKGSIHTYYDFRPYGEREQEKCAT